MKLTRRNAASGLVSTALLSLAAITPAAAASADQLIRDSDAALAQLYATQPKAKALGRRSQAILVFPRIYKAGFLIGATTGDGTLFEDGLPTAFYNTSSGSYGLQAGVQAFSLAMFFMKTSALTYLSNSSGWSIGAGPSVVVLDSGMANRRSSGCRKYSAGSSLAPLDGAPIWPTRIKRRGNC